MKLKVDSLSLEGDLTTPMSSKGLVIFAHGSGSSRKSPRNRFVAQKLNQAGLSTLLFDLLTPEEEERRFEIPLLTTRLLTVIDLCTGFNLPIGLFGASTGAAAALEAAAKEPKKIVAVVSRGGRPDMAMIDLPQVKAPTLLIVGGNDDIVIDLNKQALAKLQCVKELKIVKGATHLFEEPGTLEEVAELATSWFLRYLN